MHMQRLLRLAVAMGLLGCLSACVTLPPNHPRSKQDPWESWNRGVYRVNDGFDRHVGKPLARGYVAHVPRPIRIGIHNFFQNLNTVTVGVNDFLQGKFKAAGTDLGRLLLNTTVGVGGILDPATSAGLDKNDNDFGRTLGVWRLPPGPFVELPLLGPSDVRDTVGKVGDNYTHPQTWLSNAWIGYGLYVPYFIDLRASLLPLDETLRNAYDPYAVVRDAYLAQRAYLTGQSSGANEEPLLDPDAPEGSAQPVTPKSTTPAAPERSPESSSPAAPPSATPSAPERSPAPSPESSSPAPPPSPESDPPSPLVDP